VLFAVVRVLSPRFSCGLRQRASSAICLHKVTEYGAAMRRITVIRLTLGPKARPRPARPGCSRSVSSLRCSQSAAALLASSFGPASIDGTLIPSYAFGELTGLSGKHHSTGVKVSLLVEHTGMPLGAVIAPDRKSTRLNSSHVIDFL
jgi:hypothetical protein